MMSQEIKKETLIEGFQSSDSARGFLDAAVGADGEAAAGFPQEGNVDGGSQKELERLEAAGLFQKLEEYVPEVPVANEMIPINVRISRELESYGIKKYPDVNRTVGFDVREEKSETGELRDRLDAARRAYIAKCDTGQEKSSLLMRIFGFGADLGRFNAELQEAKSNYEKALEAYKDAVAGSSAIGNGYDAESRMGFLDKREYLDFAGAKDDARLEAGGWSEKFGDKAVGSGGNFKNFLIKYLREAGLYAVGSGDGVQNDVNHPSAQIGSDADDGNVGKNSAANGSEYAVYPGISGNEAASATTSPSEMPDVSEIQVAEVTPIEAVPAGNEFDFEIDMLAQQYRESAKNVHSPEYAKVYNDSVVALLGGRGVLMGEIMDRNAQEYIHENTQSDTVKLLDSLRKSLAGDAIGLKKLDPRADEDMFAWSARVADMMRKRWSK
ncbi:MAG: hypothetical protein WC120_05820 [Parcubacteria group bacterium]